MLVLVANHLEIVELVRNSLVACSLISIEIEVGRSSVRKVLWALDLL